MSKSFEWNETLDMGTTWESELGERLETILTRIQIEGISFEDDPETQLSGIDAVLKNESPDIDVKTQSYEHRETGNLPFETWSVAEDMRPGWFYTSESDVIVWAYVNKIGTNLLPTGYFLLKDDRLVDWFNDTIENFREIECITNRADESWTTKCRLVPIEDIPDNHITEFNPTLSEDKDSLQETLGEFL